jgi:hypothetical protein
MYKGLRPYWRSSRNKTKGFIHKKTHLPHDHSGNPWHRQARWIHSYPFHGRRGNREGYYITKNPILRPPKSMPKMPLIWAFCPNLHSDQNPNFERKSSLISTPPTWSERVARGPTDTSATHSHKNGRKQGRWSKQSSRETRLISQWKGLKQNKVHHQNWKRLGNGGVVNFPNSPSSK